ncbi:hypothetical protein BDW22DRAFT_811738 [Trametopsis cervina]|nr:hypothetical protein BDW22DRAFT_811738 [Trametopsis cervina]
MSQSPSILNANMSPHRKNAKRRKLDSVGNDMLNQPMNLGQTTTEPHTGLTKFVLTPMTCTSCHRSLARTGNAQAVAGLSCARCNQAICTICSRKCEGPSTPLLATSRPLTRDSHWPLGTVGHSPRKTLPTRRLPLRINAAVNRHLSSNESEFLAPTLPHVAGHVRQRKHDLSHSDRDTMQTENSTESEEGCLLGYNAIFCRSCVQEDPSSGSIVCLGCTAEHKV